MDNTRELSDAVIKKISAGSKAENDELRELLRSYGYHPATADDIYDVLESLSAVDNYDMSHFTDELRNNILVRFNDNPVVWGDEDLEEVTHAQFMNDVRALLKKRFGY